MKTFIFGLILLAWSSVAAYAVTGETGFTEQLEFVAETQIIGPDQQNLSLCYVTKSLRIFGYALTSDVKRYALSADNCLTETRAFTADQVITAQSLDLIPAGIDPVARNSLERDLRTYGLLAVVGLALFAVVWRRMKSLLGYDPDGQMRNKAAQRVVSVMCHAAKCDGHVGSHDLTLIARAAQNLTRRTYPSTDIIRLADHVDLELGPKDYIAFGSGLRDREKDIMVHAALLVTMANYRMLPAEYDFVTKLAQGIGMPGEDFRRVLNNAMNDLEAYATTP